MRTIFVGCCLLALAAPALATTDAERDAKHRAEFAETLQGAKERYGGRTIWFCHPGTEPTYSCTTPLSERAIFRSDEQCDSVSGSDSDKLVGAFRVLDVVAAPDCVRMYDVPACYIWFKTDRPGRLAYLAFHDYMMRDRLKFPSPKGYEDIVFEDPAVTAKKAKQQAAKAKAECERKGGVTIGMTKEQVYASCWGKPYEVNTTVVASGRHEQWIYNRGYLYFQDGILTGIQTSH
jgi:hypothetical protein